MILTAVFLGAKVLIDFKFLFCGIYRVEPVQLTFMIVGAGMGGLGLMILIVGCLSTGDTRTKVYRTWRGRVGGRISCAVVSNLVSISSSQMNKFLI